MSVRIKDIAKYLELSPATVSMILNNKQGFSEGTRARVIKAANELGYITPMSRRNVLPTGESLPFIIYKHHGQIVGETPFFSAITEAIQYEAKRFGYNVSVHYINGPDQLTTEELLSVSSSSKAGMLVLATEMEQEQVAVFSSLNLPFVLIDNGILGVKADKVLMANTQGAYDAVRALYEAGHRSIGHLKSSVFLSNFEERETGYYRGIRELELEKNSDWVVSLLPTVEGAYLDMLEFCKSTASLPTAFFVDNDIIAVGAMKALQECGYSLPDDISLIGFDDVPYCTIVEPTLSTMQVDTQNIGKVAVSLLLEDNRFHQKIEIETKLILRNSVKRRI